MADLQTTYMGLRLRNPLIAGSSGLTGNIQSITNLYNAGIGAIVLKSLFEEQIREYISNVLKQSVTSTAYSEAEDYISNYTKDFSLDQYITLIREAKQNTSIPVIASINCITASEWTSLAKKMEDAGADALELNIFILPSDTNRTGEQNEKVYFDIVLDLIRQVKIPISIKISHYFSGLAKTALRLSWTGIKGMVLFNRFYSPDIDIDNMKITSAGIFSTPDEIYTSLRWVALLSDRLHCDIAASTGVHDGEGLVKQLLAGAKAVQVASVLYKNGLTAIPEMLGFLDSWMNKHNFSSTNDFIGKMSFREIENPAAFERVQFMKNFAGIE